MSLKSEYMTFVFTCRVASKLTRFAKTPPLK
uniref:Uncharacterized protein n=1 Tax=Arundo donax TaxID=35708 RepID=A0A0A8YVM1_ARUDO